MLSDQPAVALENTGAEGWKVWDLPLCRSRRCIFSLNADRSGVGDSVRCGASPSSKDRKAGLGKGYPWGREITVHGLRGNWWQRRSGGRPGPVREGL